MVIVTVGLDLAKNVFALHAWMRQASLHSFVRLSNAPRCLR
jgi:hypothetical protein